MNTHDHYYSMKESIQNLKLLKLAHDSGIDIRDFPHYEVDYNFNIANGWEILFRTLDSLFTIVEGYFPHVYEDTANKEYWLQDANVSYEKSFLESMGILVILDDDIAHNKLYTGTLGSSDQFFHMGYAEVSSFKDGVIITWDEDDGTVDLVEILCAVIEAKTEEKEQLEYAVAV